MTAFALDATLQKAEVNQRQVVWPKRPSSCDEEGSPNNKAVKSTSSSKRDPGDHRKKKNNHLHKLGGNGRGCAGATTRRRIYEQRKRQYNAAHGSKQKLGHQNILLVEFEGRKRSGDSPAQTKGTVCKAPSETTNEYDVLRSTDVGMGRHPTDTFLDTKAARSHNASKKSKRAVVGSGRVLSLRQKYPATLLKSPGDHDLHLVTAIWHWEKKL
ncbi:hypothetical protein B0H16DRAFT_1452788 [Mycena metata]|uniref:Uncharacterized protein n=1 Tax=Mycena metata TaxID=1033252 RepID=A0AAD7JNW8_9AGAR|nr:hypothetical protein B0H16DRAFT_1452788 [Mycena metata]